MLKELMALLAQSGLGGSAQAAPDPRLEALKKLQGGMPQGMPVPVPTESGAMPMGSRQFEDEQFIDAEPMRMAPGQGIPTRPEGGRSRRRRDDEVQNVGLEGAPMDDEAMLAMVSDAMAPTDVSSQRRVRIKTPRGRHQWEGTAEDGPSRSDVLYMKDNATDGVLESFEMHFGISPDVSWRNARDMRRDLKEIDRDPEALRYSNAEGSYSTNPRYGTKKAPFEPYEREEED